MRKQLTITTEPIDEAALVSQRAMSSETGAAVCFTGVVRGTEGEANIRGLE